MAKIPFLNWKINLTKADSNNIEVNKEVFEALASTDKYEGYRPGIDPKSQIGDEEVLIPIQPLPHDILYETYRYSDVLRTVIQSLRKEIFRHGYEIEPTTATPDTKEKEFLELFLQNINDNDQDILGVCQEINNDLEIVDDGYMLLLKDYEWNLDGTIASSLPVEVIRVHPKMIQIISDKRGRPGRNPEGLIVKTCLEHRESTLTNPGITKCPKCGKELRKAYYRLQGPENEFIYYCRDEVYHASKYNPGMTYGFSQIYSVWMKIVTLMNMDKFMKDYYTKQRPPRGLLLLNSSNMETVQKAWKWMLDQFRLNPHQIPPLVMEAPEGNKGQFAQFIDFMKSMDEMQFTETRNEMRRQIGAAYQVMPIFQADLTTGGGLNNEGLQITVTNRAVEDGQKIYNEGFFAWLIEQLEIKTYKIVLSPNEEKDEIADQQLLQAKIQNAAGMQQIGYEVTFNDAGDFTFGPIGEPVKAPDPMGGLGGFGEEPPSGGGDQPSMPGGEAAMPDMGDDLGYDGEPEDVQQSMPVSTNKRVVEAKKGTYEDYTDFGCNAFGKFLEKNPSFNNESFEEYVGSHNRADRDSGELQDISMEEVQRLAKEFETEQKPQKMNKDAVTTSTEGAFNPVHDKRRKLSIKDYVKSIHQGILKEEGLDRDIQKDEDSMIEIANFIKQSMYSEAFSGLTKGQSNNIKDYLVKALLDGESIEPMIKHILSKTKDLTEKQAEVIARTETQAIQNSAREWSYKKIDPEGELKYKWIGPQDHRTTDICENISARSMQGVSLKNLRKIIRQEVYAAKQKGVLPKDYSMREWTPHFQCRHTFVRQMG